MKNSEKKGGILGASLIICGTSIGAGMLALPTVTAEGGFFPGLLSNILCWLYSYLSGIFLMEACLWSKHEQAHLPSLSREYLGNYGKLVVCFLFLFLYECLLISYFSGIAPSFDIILSFIAKSFGFKLASLTSYGVLGVSLFTILMLGTYWIDRINIILMAGLVIFFLLLLASGLDRVAASNLAEANWYKFFAPFPVLIGAYGYHNVIPSLVCYLKKDPRSLSKAIFIGTFLPLLIYSIWQFFVLGSVPAHVLYTDYFGKGIPVIEALIKYTHSPILKNMTTGFAFFAVFTSLLGVSFSMIDFWGDQFRVPRIPKYRLFLSLVTLLPPYIIAYKNPNLFVSVFGVAAGFGEALLNGLFPIIIMWIGLYVRKYKSSRPLIGGKITLGGMLLFTFLIIVLEGSHLFR